MTSLIDVVLLLLIFFMMSTKFIDEGRLQVRLPEAGIQPDGDEVHGAGAPILCLAPAAAPCPPIPRPPRAGDQRAGGVHSQECLLRLRARAC